MRPLKNALSNSLKKPLDFLAPIAKYVMDWADVDPEVSMARFDSLTMNGAALYYESSKLVRRALKEKSFDRPAFITLSEGDSVIDGEAVYAYFQERFVHEQRKLMWFGEPKWDDKRVYAYSMHLPEKHISTGSHMSVLYAPENPLYGEQGSLRICNNGQTEAQEAACDQGAEVWYSYFDYREEGKIHARLTWNPYFEETINQMVSVM